MAFLCRVGARRPRRRPSGWASNGLLLADSQNLVGDVFVELGVLARATRRLGLGTGVINPVTRHPAVTAAAIASLQLGSGGRAVLVGRGDSSLTQLGLARPSTARLRESPRVLAR
jgi:5,10-methylenetetrahydromethanopterin reductase